MAWLDRLFFTASTSGSNFRYKFVSFIKLFKWFEFVAFKTKFFILLDNRFKCMQRIMLSKAHNLKIFYSIVRFYSINMMDYFQWPMFKFSAKMLFHNVSMLWNIFSVNCYNPISMTNSPASIRSIFYDVCVTIFSKTIIMLRTIIFCMKFSVTIIYGTFFHKNIIR